MTCTQRIAYGVLLAVLPAAAHAADGPKGEPYALLVGVRQYSEAKELRQLPYAENDMAELARVLHDGGYKADNVVLMTQTAGADRLRYLPLKARIRKELDLLIKNRGEDDTVLLAFAGHGVVFKDDPDSYFCPADAQLDDKDTLLSLTEIYRGLEKCKARTKVLLVDACRNDPLADKSRAPEKLDLESVTRPPEPTKDGGVAAFFSCSRGQKAFEDDRSRHGAFFHYVIEGLQGEAAPDKDDVTLLELGAYVQRRVVDFARAEYGADQKPEISNASAQGTAALVRLDRALLLARKGQALLATHRYDQAIAEFTEAVRVKPDSAEAHALRGLAFVLGRKPDKAIPDCDEALRIDGKSALAFAARGGAYVERLHQNDDGDHKKAVADCSEAIRLNPGLVWGYVFRSEALADKADYDAALADAEKAIALEPRSPLGYDCRGYVWYSKKEYGKAIDDFTEAVRLDPSDAGALATRGAAWNDKEDYDKAIDDCTEAIRIDPKLARAFNNRGWAWDNRKEYDKAIDDYTEAIRLDPTYALAFCNRGEAWGWKSEYDKAIDDWTEAIRLDPNFANAYVLRGTAWNRKKEYDKAIADLTEAIRLVPKNFNAYRFRGYAHQGQGDEAAAQTDFDTADRLESMK